MVEFRRTHTCGALRESDAGKEVILTGWVHRHRNFGALVFIDLRDRFGITQVILDPVTTPEAYAVGHKLRAESVIAVKGKVSVRKDPNANIPTGKIEIIPQELHVLSESDVLPISVSDDTIEVNDEMRLQYRYLDMRRGQITNNLILRHKAMMSARRNLDSQGFIEVITPILGKSTPEGARDYLVPSRVYPGTFYALPQSPQMFKQILMIGGLDRYFQIATCFRDEDLRADRQPEFSQIDMEMSFATSNELFPIVEKLVQTIFKESINVDLPQNFRRMTYADCMEYYGCDKPDLRFDMKLCRLDDLAQASTFTIFHEILANKGVVKGFSVIGGADISRKEIDELTAYVQSLGGKGLVWVKRQEAGFTSSIAKFLSDDLQKKWIERLDLQVGDLAFVVAGGQKKVNQVLDHLRRKVARMKNLILPNRYEALWVTDFPLFAYNDEENRMESEHHPFTSPHLDDIHLFDTEPLKMRSSSYDLVLNGYELASGSQRIHDNKLQEKIFAMLGMSPEERASKFGFFIEALKYGTPPHLGIALGFDRIMMILCGTESMRDVIAFPKTQRAQDLMTKAPSHVNDMQLKELKIAVKT
jgi:aspartyl-tRNA synthetase